MVDGIFGDGPLSEPASSLHVLTGIADAVATLRRAERGWLEVARAEGSSWTEIGQALGISRQAARKRLLRRPPPGS